MDDDEYNVAGARVPTLLHAPRQLPVLTTLIIRHASRAGNYGTLTHLLHLPGSQSVYSNSSNTLSIQVICTNAY